MSFVKNLNAVIKPIFGIFYGVNPTIRSGCLSSVSQLKYSTTKTNEYHRSAHQEIIDDDKKESDKLFTKETISLVNTQIQDKKEGRLFAIIHVAGKQFKITPEDIIVIHGHWPPKPSDEIMFEKVLLVGGKDFTLIGRPVLPPSLVHVKATVIEKTLSHTKTHFVMQRRKQYRRINFIRNEHTMVRITDVTINGKVGESCDSESLFRSKP